MVDGDYGVQVQIRDTVTNRIIREYRDQNVNLKLPADFVTFEDYVAKKSADIDSRPPKVLKEDLNM